MCECDEYGPVPWCKIHGNPEEWGARVEEDRLAGVPDAGCYTMPDGTCISPLDCMHSSWDERSARFAANGGE